MNTENVDEEFSAFKTWISEAAAKTIPMKSNFQPNWMDEVARQAIEQKAKMRKQYGCESLEYKNTHKKAKNCIKTAKENYIKMKCEQLNALKGDIYFFEVMKEIRRGQKTTGWSVQDKNGNLITDKVSILRVWEDFYSNLYGSLHEEREQIGIDQNKNKDNNGENYHCTVPFITKEETENSIKKLKNGKSSGLDGISVELLKAGGRKQSSS